MNDRLEIAARFLLTQMTEPANPLRPTSREYLCNKALLWADALIARELETRPKPEGCQHLRTFTYTDALRIGPTKCLDCGAEVKP